MSPADIAQAQLDAYNAQDLDAYCSYFTDDVVMGALNGDVTATSREAFRTIYAGVFAKFPNNRADLVNRIVLGGSVIDHERVDRGNGVDPVFEVAAVYSFRDGRISRVDFVR